MVFQIYQVVKPIELAIFPTAQTTGDIEKVNTTNIYENRRQVYEYVFSYNVKGNHYTGKSYSTGNSDLGSMPREIIYSIQNPTNATITGQRNTITSVWIFVFVLFPIVGLGLLISSVLEGLRICRVLSYGVLTTGKYITSTSTNVRVNDRTIYKLEFTFKSQDGSMQQGFVNSAMPENLTDDKEEQLIYNQNNPTEILLIDDLPFGAESFVNETFMTTPKMSN